GSQGVNQSDIEVAPEPLRPMTPVVPEEREDACEPCRIVNQVSTAFPGFRLGQVKPLRIEQRSILNVHGELEECPLARRTKNRACSTAVADGLVVAHAGIVGVTRVLQDTSCPLVAQQPVHTDADLG